jgi:hypothetical protein
VEKPALGEADFAAYPERKRRRGVVFRRVRAAALKERCMKPHLQALALAAAVAAGAGVEARAQSATNYSSGAMWGTTSGGVAVSGAVDSADAHLANSAVAAAVTAARKAAANNNLSSSSLTIEAIGAQSIVNNQVSGSNISANIVATQSSTNSAPTSNQGTINSP